MFKLTGIIALRVCDILNIERTTSLPKFQKRVLENYVVPAAVKLLGRIAVPT